MTTLLALWSCVVASVATFVTLAIAAPTSPYVGLALVVTLVFTFVLCLLEDMRRCPC